LSGGKGTRLRPITHTSAKQLVPIGNQPILFYGLQAIRAAGVTDVGMVVGDTRRDIEEAVGDGSRFGLNVTYIQQEAPLGLAHAVLISQDYIGSDPFVMFLGDNLIKDGITAVADDFRRTRPNCQILLARVPNPQDFGVAELREGRVVGLEEKPRAPKSDLALVGVYMFDETVFDAVHSIRPSRRGELEITDAIQTMIDRRLNVRSHLITGWWKDTGKLEDMLEANRLVLSGVERDVRGSVDATSQIEGNVVLGASSTVRNSVLRGPLIVGERCRITNSYVGPFTSVADDVVLEQCEIEYSILLDRTEIRDIGARVEGSLIGKDVRIGKVARKPHAYRFMIGDSSQVDVL
jgi:glucose-1-phosphate thymidylyltransferase